MYTLALTSFFELFTVFWLELAAPASPVNNIDGQIKGETYMDEGSGEALFAMNTITSNYFLKQKSQ